MGGSNCLLDTGPAIAYFRYDDPHHAECEEFVRDFKGRFLTTESVLTETVVLMSRVPGGVSTALDFFVRGAAVLIPQSPKTLQRARVLMQKYADVPMDFADATLVALAEAAMTGDIFTLDKDFRIYRWFGNKNFRIHPE